MLGLKPTEEEALPPFIDRQLKLTAKDRLSATRFAR